MQTVLNLVDPFPDTALDPAGWPGLAEEHTVPLAITKFGNITAPAGTTIAGWNFKVLFFPVSLPLSSTGWTAMNVANGVVSSPGTTAASTLSQFNVYTWRAEDSEPNWVRDAPAQSFYCDPSAGNSLLRFCAAGFELINTSTALNKGGMQYGFRSPLSMENITYTNTSLPGTIGATRTILAGGPPNILNDIINLASTISGPADNGIGVYSLPLDAINTPQPRLPENVLPYSLYSETDAFVRLSATSNSRLQPWQVAGAYVTGLVPSATFTLKARVFYEIIPNAFSSDLLKAVARPPTPHSYVVHEMLCELLRTMPAGFDYSENPLGEWFDKVLSTLATVIPIIGNALPHPVFKGVAMAASPVITGIQEYRKAQKAKHPPPITAVKPVPKMQPKRKA